MNLTRDALQELQKLPIELLSLNSASGLQPHDEPIVLPRSLRALAIIGDALPTKALLAEAGRHQGLLSVRAWRANANDADAIALAQSSSLKTIDLASNGVTGRRERADRHAETDRIGPLEQPDRLERFDQLTASRMPASSRLSRVDLSDNPDLSEASIPALYRLPLQALNLSGTNVTRYPEDDRKPPQTARTTPGPDGTGSSSRRRTTTFNGRTCGRSGSTTPGYSSGPDRLPGLAARPLRQSGLGHLAGARGHGRVSG